MRSLHASTSPRHRNRAGLLHPLPRRPGHAAVTGCGRRRREEKAAGADLFGLTRVVKLHIQISAEEYESMQPPAPPGAPGAPPPARRPQKPGERASERNLFGTEFRWARGYHIRWEDVQGREPPVFRERLVPGVGWGPEAFPVDRAGQARAGRFSRASRSSFKAVRSTPRRRRETLAFAFFREAGVPAPVHGLGRSDPHRPGRT